MLPRQRPLRVLVALGLAATVAVPIALAPSPAEAVPVETGNACFYSFDNYYRDLEITLDGGATPNPLPAGETATLTATFSGSMPDWIPAYGYNYGLLTVGENRIPTKIWIAIEGVGSVEEVQIVEVDVDAITTVEDPDGTPQTDDEDGTPPTVDVELPATTWTSTGGPIELRQASGGTLVSLPGMGPDGSDVTPEGSAFISAQLSAEMRFTLDCQPGAYDAANRGETFTAAEAEPFDVVEAGTATASTEAETTTTTAGSDLDTAPPILIAPAPAADDSSDDGINIGLLIAAIVIPLAGVAVLVWYLRRTRKAAAERAAAAGTTPPDTDTDPDASETTEP